jgi:hypothetical protein
MANSYTAKQFIDAIPNTGGVISDIAKKVGCSWHTAKKYIDEYSTVNEAWQAERNRITDKARNNIIKAIEKSDLQMSKWWLQVMDDEFVPRERREVDQSGGVEIVVRYADDKRNDTDSA